LQQYIPPRWPTQHAALQFSKVDNELDAVAGKVQIPLFLTFCLTRKPAFRPCFEKRQVGDKFWTFQVENLTANLIFSKTEELEFGLNIAEERHVLCSQHLAGGLFDTFDTVAGQGLFENNYKRPQQKFCSREK